VTLPDGRTDDGEAEAEPASDSPPRTLLRSGEPYSIALPSGIRPKAAGQIKIRQQIKMLKIIFIVLRIRPVFALDGEATTAAAGTSPSM
jgi:hypothetical protein